jgi:carboxyl-terminal processing protease
MYRKTLFHLIIMTVLMVGIFNAGCKKDPKPAPVPVVTAKDLSKDTLYYLFKDEYLFTDLIPAYDIVNPRASANNDSLFAKLTRYSTAPKDHYSFIDKGGSVASQIGQGVSQGDIGIEIFYPNSANLSDLRVKSVTKGSPAYTNGVRKGWQITSIDGNTNIAYDGSDVGGSSANIQRVVTAVYYSTSAVFVFKKPDATSVTKTLAAASYTIDPVVLDSVYTFGARKVGYMVFSSFIAIAKIKTELNAVFSRFATKGVTDLVIDLRFNGGGDVGTSEYLANLIAPKSVGTDSTKAMYTYDFNSRFKTSTYSTLTKAYKLPPPDQKYSYADLFDSYYYWNKTTSFVKKGNVDVQNVVFIVTKSTASASELLMNNLKPYMNVSLIGKPTYGKPVGFFPIPIGGYDMYTISFRTINANSVGDYYNGMPVAVDLYEDFAHDFGDIAEVYLNAALVKLGVKSLPILKAQSASIGTLDNSKLERGFKGMIETRFKKIK